MTSDPSEASIDLEVDPDHLESALETLNDLASPLKSTWKSDGWLAVFSCNRYAQVFHSSGSGSSDEEDLRGESEFLDRVVDAVLKVRPRGGRIFIDRGGVYSWDKSKGEKAQIIRFESKGGEPGTRDRPRSVESQRSQENNPPKDHGSPTPTSDGSLLELLRECRAGSTGGVIGALEDEDDLQDALYIRTEEDELVERFCSSGASDGKILLLTGSAGDGKTAMLRRAMDQAVDSGAQPLPEAHRDATEAWDPKGTITETLDRFLGPAIERMVEEEGQRSALAINLGVGVRFFKEAGFSDRPGYSEVWDALREATHTGEPVERDNLLVINLSRRSLFSYLPESFGEGFLEDYIQQFAFEDPGSPFHEAYRQQNWDQVPDLLQYNLQTFATGELTSPLAQLIAARTVIEDTRLNPRRLQYFLADLLYPEDFDEPGKIGNPESLLIWNRIYNLLERQSERVSRYVDPAARIDADQDREALRLIHRPQIRGGTLEDLIEEVPGFSDLSPIQQIRTHLRKRTVRSYRETKILEEAEILETFLAAFSFILDPEERRHLHHKYQELEGDLIAAMESWGSESHEGLLEFHDGRQTTEHRFLAEWSRPDIHPGESKRRTEEDPRPGHLWVALQRADGGDEDSHVSIPLSFPTYELLRHMHDGYAPSSLDIERSEGVRLIREKISELTKKEEEVVIEDVRDGRRVKVKTDPFEAFTIRRLSQ